MESAQKKRGRKLGQAKPVERRRVRLMISLSPEMARALEERIAPGERSEYIDQLLRRSFGL